MEHVFVWTFKDVAGLIIWALIFLAVLAVWAINAFQNWRDARRKRAAKDTGETS